MSLGTERPDGGSMPIRWASDDAAAETGVPVGGNDIVLPAEDRFDQGSGPEGSAFEPEPDAVARGWIRTVEGDRAEALFVLAGRTLGVGRTESVTSPDWLDLDQVLNVDAIGDPEAGSGPLVGEVQQVEIAMEDSTVLRVGWTLPFCDAVVHTLQLIADARRGVRGSGAPDVRFETVDEDAAPPAGEQAPVAPEGATTEQPISAAAPAAPGGGAGSSTATAAATAPSTAPAPAAPAPFTPDAQPSGSLELEDVVYLGGYPGQTRRRKKCRVAMTRTGLELVGPGDLNFRLAWDIVRTIEVQNSDEARFRINTKIHRDASALVIECDPDVTLLIEARDCPTIALRTAIGQLLTDMPVVVV